MDMFVVANKEKFINLLLSTEREERRLNNKNCI